MSEPIEGFNGEFEFLSNFYRLSDGTTLEHRYQAAKTDDPEWRQRILHADKPGQAKRLGKKCPLRPGWERMRIDVMRGLLAQKFEDLELQEALLATGDRELIEENYWKDRFWGVYMGRGENWLGKLLMETRAKLAPKPQRKKMIHPCICTATNGSQCYNCLNGAHSLCHGKPKCKKRTVKYPGLRIVYDK